MVAVVQQYREKGMIFYQDCVAAAPPSFPKQIHGFNFTSSRVRTQTSVFSPAALYFSSAAPPIVLLKAVFFSCFASHFNFQGLCRNAVASQHRRVTIPGAEEVGRKNIPISASEWQWSVLETHLVNHCIEQGQIFIKRNSRRGWLLWKKYIN